MSEQLSHGGPTEEFEVGLRQHAQDILNDPAAYSVGEQRWARERLAALGEQFRRIGEGARDLTVRLAAEDIDAEWAEANRHIHGDGESESR